MQSCACEHFYWFTITFVVSSVWVIFLKSCSSLYVHLHNHVLNNNKLKKYFKLCVCGHPGWLQLSVLLLWKYQLYTWADLGGLPPTEKLLGFCKVLIENFVFQPISGAEEKKIEEWGVGEDLEKKRKEEDPTTIFYLLFPLLRKYLSSWAHALFFSKEEKYYLLSACRNVF